MSRSNVMFRQIVVVITILALVRLLAVGLPVLTAGGADHLEAPLVQADGRIDIADVYAFQSPEDEDNTGLIMTVNPAAGVMNGTTFSPDHTYNFKIDNEGTFIEEITYEVTFSAPSSVEQDVTLKRNGVVVAEGETSTDDEEEIDVDGGGSLFAGLRDDPFFFDLIGFTTLAFCATDPSPDFFAGLNVSAIVLEVPSSELTDDSVINAWATVENGGGMQLERMGNQPSQPC